jgi:hypothetical protein
MKILNLTFIISVVAATQTWSSSFGEKWRAGDGYNPDDAKKVMTFIEDRRAKGLPAPGPIVLAKGADVPTAKGRVIVTAYALDAQGDANKIIKKAKKDG